MPLLWGSRWLPKQQLDPLPLPWVNINNTPKKSYFHIWHLDCDDHNRDLTYNRIYSSKTRSIEAYPEIHTDTGNLLSLLFDSF